MHSVVSRTRRSEDATTPLRSGLLNPNGGVKTLAKLLDQQRWLMPLLLWLLTLMLWLPGLGNLPLRDWDEGRVATVARSSTNLLPMKWQQPYLNKPPGLHAPMGQLIRAHGEQDALVRLLPALLSTLAVPLIVLMRRELGGSDRQRRALLAGVVLMTLLPMARHGRLAMLDGTLVSCSLLLWWSWIRARQHPLAALSAGIAGSGVLLLKPPALLGLGLIALVVGGRNSWPRWRGWIGFSLGLLPGLSWHLWHWSVRGEDALLMWGGQGLARITSSVGDGHGWWTPWVEVLEGGWPWLLLLPIGLHWAWRQRHNSAGRWELGLLLGSAALVLPLRTQLPWYSHLLWPPLALLCAEGLAQLLDSGAPRWVGRCWQVLGLGLSLAGLSTLVIREPELPSLSLLLAGFGLLAGGQAIRHPQPQRRRRGLAILVIAWGLALLALWHSRLWLWELNESWDPRPVAAQVRTLPADASVWLKGPTRPSLGWYAGRNLLQYRKSEPPKGPYWLVSNKPMPGCLPSPEPLPGEWQLWTCE